MNLKILIDKINFLENNIHEFKTHNIAMHRKIFVKMLESQNIKHN